MQPVSDFALRASPTVRTSALSAEPTDVNTFSEIAFHCVALGSLIALDLSLVKFPLSRW